MKILGKGLVVVVIGGLVGSTWACNAPPEEEHTKTEAPAETSEVVATTRQALTPPSCTEMESVCFWDKLLAIGDVMAQLQPGCGGVETVFNIGTTGVALANATTWFELINAYGMGVCDLIGCLTSNSKEVIQLQAACATGALADAWIRCSILRAECADDLASAHDPVNPSVDYPCPYVPSVQACAPGGGPLDDGSIVGACGAVIRGYGISDPNVRNQCMAVCVRTTNAAREGCPPPLANPPSTGDGGAAMFVSATEADVQDGGVQ